MSASEDLARLARLASKHRQEISLAGGAEAIADWLYSNWYIDPDSVPPEEQTSTALDHLGSALSALVARAAPWGSDWVVLSAMRDGSIVAGRGVVTRWQPAGFYASAMRFGLPPAPGEQVSLPALLSWVDPPTGQWAAQTPEAPPGPLVRIYFNVGWSDIGYALEAVLPKLTEAGLPFSMKCPGVPAGFARADTLLLYLESSAWEAVGQQVLEALKASRVRLRKGRPALTKPLRDGIAFAEDPGDGQSFGRNRCMVLASALIGDRGGKAELLAPLEEALVEAGIDPEHPWSNPS